MGVSLNGGTKQPWGFLLKMIILGSEMGVPPFKETPTWYNTPTHTSKRYAFCSLVELPEESFNNQMDHPVLIFHQAADRLTKTGDLQVLMSPESGKYNLFASKASIFSLCFIYRHVEQLSGNVGTFDVS